MLQKIDFIATKYALKPLMRGHCFSQKEFITIRILCGNHGLTAVRSAIKIKNPALEEEKGYCVYISKDKRLAQKCANEDPEYAGSGDLSGLKYFSKSLGYPECCIDSYINLGLGNLSGEKKKEVIFKKITRNNKPFLLNNFLYGMGMSLSFYEPCSYGCKYALSYNKKIMEAVRKEDPLFAARIREYLQLPMLIWLNVSENSSANDFFHNRIQLLFKGSLKRQNTIYYEKAALYRKFPRCNPTFDEGQLEEASLGNICKVYKDRVMIFDRNTAVKEIKVDNKYHAVIVKFN